MAKNAASLTGKEIQIIAMFQQGLDAKEIANRLHFTDYRQMAIYMKARGYIWDSLKKNYELSGNATHAEESILSREEAGGPKTTEAPRAADSQNPDSAASMLTFLELHKETLTDLVANHVPAFQMPRYVISGVYTTKSVYMNHNLDLLAREFSEEKNISQRDIFEIALIDFFKKYGYRDQVKMIIG
jgi:hypothetical protein